MGKKEKDSYVVVFRGAGDHGNYPGVITWTEFDSEDQFNQWLLETGVTDEVVASGITANEAINIVRNSSALPDIGLAFHEATRGGEFNEALLEMKLQTLAYVRRLFPPDDPEQDDALFGGFPRLGE